MSDKTKFNQVNKSFPKVDGLALAAGKPLFVDDEEFPGLLFGKILTSPHAHAVIRDIDTSEAEALPGVHAVLTYKNVPRIPHTTAGQGFPEPSPYDTYILDKKVRYVGDRVAAVAAETEDIAIKACSLIKVDYQVLEPVLDAKKALEEGAPVIHDEEDCSVIIPIPYEPKKNLAAMVDVKAGDPEKAFRDAETVIEHEYESQYGSHTAIEPHVSIAYLDGYERLVIRTSTQVPFHVRRIVAQALDFPLRKIRVIKPRIGGGFGGKQEVLLEDLVSLLCLRTKRPVKIEYTRSEDLVSSRTRHPQFVTIKTAMDKNNEITAIHMDVLSNTGAYGSHALTVACNCGSKVLPLYRCPNIGFRARTAYTTLPVGGAYRGYGATQAAFAMEVQMDEIAHMLKLDPVEFRRKYHIKSGETSPIFEALGEGKSGVAQSIGSNGLEECLSLGAKAINWTEKRKQAEQGRGSKDRYKYGVGMCALMQGSSIPEIDMGAAQIKMNEDGSFNLLLGATDLGTGSDTIMAQIAAEVIGCNPASMIVYSSDTDMTPFDVGAYASSTTYLSGQAVINAAQDTRDQILKVAADMMEVPEKEIDKITIANEEAVYNTKRVSFADIGLYSLYERNQFQILGKGSHITKKSPPPFSAHYVTVKVDTWTGKTTVLKYVAAVDCGVAINPLLAKGQTEGGVLNGISYALTEEYLFNSKGKMLNDSLKHYKIFSTADLPDIETIIVPTYEETGPFGAKSVSEICINGALPSISNAIYNATGVRLRSGPFTSEKVLQGLESL